IKNSWLRIQSLFAIGFILSGWLAAAQSNLTTNPDFETGDSSGWGPFGPVTLVVETSQVHSGTYACLVTNRTSSGNGIVQSFLGDLQLGQTYNVSAWLRLASGANQTMQ